MYRLLLALSVLLPFSAFAMDHQAEIRLSRKQLIAVMRTTIAAQTAADMLYAKTGVAKKPHALPANIAIDIAQEVVNAAQRGVILTDGLIVTMIGDSLADIFQTVGRTKINIVIGEEVRKNLPDGIVPK